MKIDVRGKRGKRRVLSLPTLIFFVAQCVFALGALLVGVTIGAYFVDTGNESYIRFLTKSSFAQNYLYPSISWAKSISAGENVPGNFASGVLAAERADHLSIDIAHIDYQRIAYKREQALEQGILFADPTDYVPATITSGDETARVKVRLKGDLPDHYETDKWSLRIRVRGDNTFWGMKRFSIQHPQTRNYVGEWLFLKALRREGIVTPRYRFVDVSINGARKGIYAVEEHFERRLLANAERREGPIIRFFEDLKWIADLEDYDKEEYAAFSSSPVDGYTAAEVAHGSEYERAVTQLEAFRRGELTTSEAFDAKKLAHYIATRDLSGAIASSWQNYRFYYNPVTSKLEPVAFDCEADIHEPIRMLFSFDGGIMYKDEFYQEHTRPDDPLKLYFADLDFFEEYVRALDRISRPEYWEELMREFGSGLREQLAIVHRDYPYYRWSEKAFRKNAQFIRSALEPPRAMHAFHQETFDDSIALRVAGIQSLPVEVLGLSHLDGEPVEPLERTVLRSKRRHAPPNYAIASFPRPAAWRGVETLASELIVHYRILGTEKVYALEVYPWTHTLDSIVRDDWISGDLGPEGLDWLAVDEDASLIRVDAGAHVLERTLVVPADYELVAGPGVRIDLQRGAKIISKSPLRFIGSEDHPVILESTDSTGQGLVVMQAGADSTLSHVVFENLDAPRGNGWQVTGAVTFYESPVELDSVLFKENRCEDALNIMRTHFTMAETTFHANVADSFDGDFVVGKIADCRFTRCGNDAVDFSGSHIEIVDTVIDGAGDKALSAGEHSDVVARNVSIINAELAVTSKDLSTLSFVDGKIAASRVAFCAFQKKPEFGGGSISIVRAEVEDAEKEYLIEPGSQVSRDGKEVDSYQEGVKELLYGAEYGRESN